MRATPNTSTAHSLVISGSLYVLHTIGAPSASARSTMCPALIGRTGESAAGSRSACDVTQFWQYEQCRSQPSIPKLSAPLPGRKWKNGFFSTGSQARPAT